MRLDSWVGLESWLWAARMGISPKQFEEIEKRLNSGGRRAVSAVETTATTRLPHGTMILGLDPSLRGTGWAVIETGTRPLAVAYGTIKNPARWDRSRCLLQISLRLREILREHPASICALEGLFFAQNLQTALIMGEARGAAICAIAEAGLELFELAPRKVKQAIVGYGGAQKIAVAKMVQRMLQLTVLPDPDAADALALALTYAQETGRHSLNPPKRV